MDTELKKGDRVVFYQETKGTKNKTKKCCKKTDKDKKKNDKRKSLYFLSGKNQFYEITTGRCKICGTRIEPQYRSLHLSSVHKITPDKYNDASYDEIKRMIANAPKPKQTKSKDQQNKHYPERIPVGTVINGRPFVRMIVNPVGSKR